MNNNTKKSSLKSTIIIIIVVVLGVIAYFYYQGTVPAVTGQLSQSDAETDAASAAVMQLLAQVDSIHIDAKFFSAPTFQTLRDYTVSIPQQNVGRSNPFAPFPGMILHGASSGSAGH